MALDNALEILKAMDEPIAPSSATLIAPATRNTTVEYVQGHSGTYIVERDADTGEIVRDGRPWQMTSGAIY